MLYKNKSINGVSSNADGQTLPIAPAISLAQSNIPALTTAQDVAINSEASMIRIFTKDNPIFLRFKSATQTSSATNSAFDEYIPAGQMLDIGIPTDGFNPTAISIMAETSTACIIMQK